MIYLFDTNVVAEITTRPRPHPAVLAWFHSTPRPNRYLSVLTVAEIEAGVATTPTPSRQAHFSRVLAELRTEYRRRIAAIGEKEAATYLALHQRLKAGGQGIDPPDALIAATALANDWTPASRNTKHLARTGVRLINPWHYQD
jgi:hypothetical protein